MPLFSKMLKKNKNTNHVPVIFSSSLGCAERVFFSKLPFKLCLVFTFRDTSGQSVGFQMTFSFRIRTQFKYKGTERHTNAISGCP